MCSPLDVLNLRFNFTYGWWVMFVGFLAFLADTIIVIVTTRAGRGNIVEGTILPTFIAKATLCITITVGVVRDASCVL